MTTQVEPRAGVLPILSHWIDGRPVEVLPENTGPVFDPSRFPLTRRAPCSTPPRGG